MKVRNDQFFLTLIFVKKNKLKSRSNFQSWQMFSHFGIIESFFENRRAKIFHKCIENFQLKKIHLVRNFSEGRLDLISRLFFHKKMSRKNR